MIKKTTHDHKDEAGVSNDVTTQKGKEFDEATNNLNSKNAKDVELSSNQLIKDSNGYTKDLKGIAESYIKHLDTNNDGYINKDEFVEHELKNIKEEYKAEGKDMSSEDEAKLKKSLEAAYAQMDLNKSDKIDWKEMTSTIATFDSAGKILGSKGGDGKISASDYKTAQNNLTDGKFGIANKANYKQLFSSDKEK